jgi:hypothetical protein
MQSIFNISANEEQEIWKISYIQLKVSSITYTLTNFV